MHAATRCQRVSGRRRPPSGACLLRRGRRRKRRSWLAWSPSRFVASGAAACACASAAFRVDDERDDECSRAEKVRAAPCFQIACTEDGAPTISAHDVSSNIAGASDGLLSLDEDVGAFGLRERIPSELAPDGLLEISLRHAGAPSCVGPPGQRERVVRGGSLCDGCPHDQRTHGEPEPKTAPDEMTRATATATQPGHGNAGTASFVDEACLVPRWSREQEQLAHGPS